MVEFRVSDVLSVLVVGGAMVATLMGITVPAFYEQAFIMVILFYFATEAVNRTKMLEVREKEAEVKILELENPD